MPTTAPRRSEYWPSETLNPANSIVASRRDRDARALEHHEHEEPARPEVADDVVGEADERVRDGARAGPGNASAGRPRVATTLPANATAPRPVRVWVDLTNSPHVLVLRPVVEALRARGAEVEVTARDFAQTVGLPSASASTAR